MLLFSADVATIVFRILVEEKKSKFDIFDNDLRSRFILDGQPSVTSDHRLCRFGIFMCELQSKRCLFISVLQLNSVLIALPTTLIEFELFFCHFFGFEIFSSFQISSKLNELTSISNKKIYT